MRGTFISILALCLVMVSAQPLAVGKKNKKDKAARLRSLQTIYVDGSGTAASYIRKNLSRETCLQNTPERSEADAILDIEEESPVPCEMGSPGMCTSLTAQLIDAKTNEALWLVADDHLPMMDLIHQLKGPPEWVLWNLKNACCKNRPIPAQPKDQIP
jgi:hypothetical protein